MKSYSQKFICAHYSWKKEDKYMILYFEAGVPEYVPVKDMLSFKQVKPWHWHTEVVSELV